MANNDQGNRKVLRWGLAGLTLVIIIITAVVLFNAGGGGKKPTSNNQDQPRNAKAGAGLFIRAVLVADSRASFDLMSDRLQEQLGGLHKWNVFLKTNFGGGKELITLVGSEDLQTDDNPKPVRLTYDVRINDENGGKIELVMRQNDNSWKVDEFVFSNDEP